MTLPSGPVPSFPNTIGLQDGRALNKLAGLIGSVSTITAKAGGTKAAATEITGVKCLIDVCATNGDSALLPPGYPGLEVTIFNAGAANAQIFGNGSDTINEIATGTGVTQNAGISAVYTCYSVVAGVGIWGRTLSA
jgi:hypothetical protein